MVHAFPRNYTEAIGTIQINQSQHRLYLREPIGQRVRTKLLFRNGTFPRNLLSSASLHRSRWCSHFYIHSQEKNTTSFVLNEKNDGLLYLRKWGF